MFTYVSGFKLAVVGFITGILLGVALSFAMTKALLLMTLVCVIALFAIKQIGKMDKVKGTLLKHWILTEILVMAGILVCIHVVVFRQAFTVIAYAVIAAAIWEIARVIAIHAFKVDLQHTWELFKREKVESEK